MSPVETVVGVGGGELVGSQEGGVNAQNADRLRSCTHNSC